MDRLEAIERLARLRDSGVLSEQEFQDQKTRVLNGPSRLSNAASATEAAPSNVRRPVDRGLEFETRLQMEYDACKKSILLAYALWFLLFWVSAHRFYLHRWKSAVLQIVLGGLSFILLFGGFFVGMALISTGHMAGLSAIWLGLLPFTIWSTWWLIDGILMSSLVRKYNQTLARTL